MSGLEEHRGGDPAQLGGKGLEKQVYQVGRLGMCLGQQQSRSYQKQEENNLESF